MEPCNTAGKKRVTENLLLLDIKPASFSEDFAKCRDANGLLYIKGCRRDVLVGRAPILKDSPDLRAEGVTVYEGVKAYAHLLTYVTGLISRTRGENQIVSQFKRAYSELIERSPETAKDLHRLFRHIIHDNGIIRNNVTQCLKPAFYEACAHELSLQEERDVILVVANTHKNGLKPNEETENIVRYIGNNRKGAARKIVFTHPDEDVLKNIYGYFLRKKVHGSISSEIGMISFGEAFDANNALQRIDRVYVCFPMGQDAQADQKMIEEWRQKEAFGGQLLHLRGGQNRRKSEGAWSNPELFNYIAPERITDWQKQRQSKNEQVIKRGAAACYVCAEMRDINQRPNAQMFCQS